MPTSRQLLLSLGLVLILGLRLSAQQPAGERSAQAGDTQPSQELKLRAASESEKLLDEALVKIERLNQFSADIRQTIEMFGYRFTGTGRYLLAPDFQMRFEMKLQLTSETSGSLLEVCDGKVHWTSLKILDTHELERFDLERARKIFDDPEFDQATRRLLIKHLGFSGLLPMLQGLRDSQKFEQHEEAELDGKPVYVLHGSWKEEAFNGVSVHRRPVTLATLPPFVPSKSTLWIDRSTGWPYRFEFRSDRDAENETETVIQLEFLNPRIGVELPKSQFVFEPPPDVEPRDRTDQICQQLTRALRQARRIKAQANDSKDSGFRVQDSGNKD